MEQHEREVLEAELVSEPTTYPKEEPHKQDRVISFQQILLIILLIFILLFWFVNFNQVEVNLLFAKIQAPLVVIIFLSYILGSIITWLIQALKRNRNR